MFSRRTPGNLSENPIAKAIVRAGEGLLDLTLSNPTQAGFSYPPEILGAFSDPQILRYEPDPRGLLQAREALLAHLEKKGICSTPEKVFLTASTSEAYSFLFKLLCDPGDEVLVPEPSYPLLEHLLSLECAERVSYRLEWKERWRIDFDSIEGALSKKTRAIALVQPNNPTGNYLLPEERRELLKIAAAHKLAIISDEVFWDYPLKELPAGAKSFAGEKDALCFALGGLSKSLALPQMKLGWILASGPEGIFSECLPRLELICDSYLSVSAPVQAALPKLLPIEKGVQEQIRSRAQKNLAALESALRGSAKALPVEGGWYAMIALPEAMDEEALVIELIEKEKALVQPGYFYDCEGNFLVVSLLVPEKEFGEGAARIKNRLSR